MKVWREREPTSAERKFRVKEAGGRADVFQGCREVLDRNQVGSQEEYGSYLGEKLLRNIPVRTQI